MSRQQELESMSDFEINCLIEGILNLESLKLKDCDGEPFLEHPETFDEIDYCNNPSDIMPIAFDNKICLMFNDDSSEWVAYLSNLEVAIDGNPLRAICIVFILMSEAKQ